MHLTVAKPRPQRGAEVNARAAANAQSTLVEMESAAEDSPKSETAPKGPFASNALLAGARFQISELLPSRSESS